MAKISVAGDGWGEKVESRHKARKPEDQLVEIRTCGANRAGVGNSSSRICSFHGLPLRDLRTFAIR